MAAKTGDHKFPDALYVSRETDHAGDTIGFATAYAVEDVDADQDGELVAVYRLERVAELKVTRELLDT